jgi:acyl carrier protein
MAKRNIAISETQLDHAQRMGAYMSNQDIEKDVCQILSDLFGIDKLQFENDSNFVDIPGWSSLVHLRAIIAIQNELKLSFSTDESVRLSTVRDLIELVKSKKKAA